MVAKEKQTLNQLVHTLSYGDAISSEALTIKSFLGLHLMTSLRDIVVGPGI